jgi:uncharacterized protein (TIGR02599 family)
LRDDAEAMQIIERRFGKRVAGGVIKIFGLVQSRIIEVEIALKHGRTTDSPQGTQHMLPPRVVVTLVAIDEASARKLALKYPDTMPQLVPTDAFTLADNKQKDLKDLATRLRAEQLNYQVFSTTISMRNSKWGLLR